MYSSLNIFGYLRKISCLSKALNLFWLRLVYLKTDTMLHPYWLLEKLHCIGKMFPYMRLAIFQIDPYFTALSYYAFIFFLGFGKKVAVFFCFLFCFFAGICRFFFFFFFFLWGEGGFTFKTDYFFFWSIKILGIFIGYCKNRGLQPSVELIIIFI